MFIRFQSPTAGRRGIHAGVFGLANGLAANGDLSEQEYADWRAGNDWYNAAYPNPSDVDPSVYDRDLNPLATAWFKDSATHLLARIPRYLEILATHGVACVRVETDDPGRIIYEDAVQVVAVPRSPDASTSFQPQSEVPATTRGPRASVVCQSSE